ncbi:MAG: hypothetical protein H6Q64_1785 [Firmicutes bacterium]|nr:hypothetical protein [Bacillota bacterium]
MLVIRRQVTKIQVRMRNDVDMFFPESCCTKNPPCFVRRVGCDRRYLFLLLNYAIDMIGFATHIINEHVI